MTPVKRSKPSCPGRLTGLSLAACAAVAPLWGVPATAAEQGSLRDLSVAHGKHFGSATDNSELSDATYSATVTDWSKFDETDHYSQAANTAYADSPWLAAYVGSTLAWGVEP
ncbi:hypothetical protein WDA79_07970 [Streptomyces sp. A475]|uniref:hypothetical protein n=1 Tax=Streptomyces sp. A475 TaxID=3131976 RepID=UPI0030CA0838